MFLAPGERWTALADDARAGLTASPKSLPPVWFYDERGSRLFDEINRLPEYNPTAAEREILSMHAEDIATGAGADTLVELGSGTSDKTRLLLDSMSVQGTLRRFVPFDVTEETLEPRLEPQGRATGSMWRRSSVIFIATWATSELPDDDWSRSWVAPSATSHRASVAGFRPTCTPT